ncbi:MAG TPA: hypothetical protein VGC76_05525 [Pyrinomonadaceae bacterium]|jgi:hypothetical protein
MNVYFNKIFTVFLATAIVLPVTCLPANAQNRSGNPPRIAALQKAEPRNTALNTDSANDAVAADLPNSNPNSAEICAAPTEISYEEMPDYVNDFNKRLTGECLLISNVPAFSNIVDAADEYGNHKGLFYLEINGQTQVGNSFVTSDEMAHILPSRLKSNAISLRVTAVLVEFSDEFEIFRSPYAAKIEGLDENNNILWEATVKMPRKLKLPA